MPADMDVLVAKLAKVPLLQSLSEEALFNVASHLEFAEFGPHDRIIRQGDFGDRFYIIEEGEVEVYVHGAYVVNLKEGTFFGEQALLTNAPRNASIVAAENGCKCLTMSRADFETYLGPLRDHMDRVNERRQMVIKRNKMMKSKLGSRMAALDRLINPDLAAELDAQEDADKANSKSAGPAKANINRQSSKDSKSAVARSQVPVSRRHRGTVVARAKEREETWQGAMEYETAMRKRIVERNDELLHDAAMARQTAGPQADALVQSAAQAGSTLVTKTAANTAPPPPPPRRHALQHNCHSWVVWEGARARFADRQHVAVPTCFALWGRCCKLVWVLLLLMMMLACVWSLFDFSRICCACPVGNLLRCI
jgi:CRP-like cAMP-binding protein